MKSISLVLMSIAVVTVGTFALPATMSLFAGQHYWYNLNAEGNQVPCEKCHADIFEELDLSDVHVNFTGGTAGAADRRDCEACHRADARFNYSKGDGAGSYTPGTKAHAASVVACMLCHELGASNVSTLAGYPATGFNITGLATSEFNYSNGTYTGEYEAHNAFIARAIDNTTLQDSNEACVTCHTHVAVKINWTHARSLEFDIGIGTPMTTDVGVHNWTLSNWAVNGTANAIVWGNTTGAGNTSGTNWPGNVDGIYS